MTRAALTISVGILTMAGIAAARHDEDAESIKPVAVYDIREKLEGKDMTASVVEVTIDPGKIGAAHRHPGPAFGYVLEGEYEWAIDDQPAKVLKAGEAFYEPAGCLHRVTANPGKVKTRLLAWVVHPKDATDIVVPEKP